MFGHIVEIQDGVLGNRQAMRDYISERHRTYDVNCPGWGPELVLHKWGGTAKYTPVRETRLPSLNTWHRVSYIVTFLPLLRRGY